MCHGKSVEYIPIHYRTNFSPQNFSIIFGFGFGFEVEFGFGFEFELEFEFVWAYHHEFIE